MDLSMFSLDWVTTFVVLGLTVLLVYLYGTWTFSTWSQLGIPGPKPLPYLGNVLDFKQNGTFDSFKAWHKKYGKHFGIYLMRRPMLVTTDLEILKEVFIKDFNNYTDRWFQMVENPLIPHPIDLSLAPAKGDQWKRQRNTMAPSFSASKLRLMGHFISKCCQNLVCAVEKSTDAGELFDVKQTFGSFTVDVIAGTGFGLEINSLVDVDNVFAKNAKEVLGDVNQFGASSVLASAFPWLGRIMKKMGFSTHPLREVQFLADAIEAVIEERRRNKKTSQDLTQLMLNAEASDSKIATNPSRRYMTRDEIVGQGLLFFVAGYDTTAAALQYLTYLLALHPEKQEKLYRQVTAAIGDADPTYDTVLNISYLDSCIREALRLFPIVAIVNRYATVERTISGVTIPAGAGVGFNVVSLMKDEEIFPEPEKFMPERFEDDQHPLPSVVRELMFGAGPRQCMGMRLALYESKMAIASLVRKFRFSAPQNTPEKLTLSTSVFSAPTDRILLTTEHR